MVSAPSRYDKVKHSVRTATHVYKHLLRKLTLVDLKNLFSETIQILRFCSRHGQLSPFNSSFLIEDHLYSFSVSAAQKRNSEIKM
jgi:hypothetical protein